MTKKFGPFFLVAVGVIAVILAVVFFATGPYVYHYTYSDGNGGFISGGATISDFMNFVKNSFGALFLILGLGFIGFGLTVPASKENK
jgi:uncharacterized membrane protein